jgi:antitoxin CptB
MVVSDDFHGAIAKISSLQPQRILMRCQLSCRPPRYYMAQMHPDAELKRLSWRAHHRGTYEADLLVGGFFDAHHQSWGSAERALFADMLEEQDVDIMAWASGTADAPDRYKGPMLEALRKLDYIPTAR